MNGLLKTIQYKFLISSKDTIFQTWKFTFSTPEASMLKDRWSHVTCFSWCSLLRCIMHSTSTPGIHWLIYITDERKLVILPFVAGLLTNSNFIKDFMINCMDETQEPTAWQKEMCVCVCVVCFELSVTRDAPGLSENTLTRLLQHYHQLTNTNLVRWKMYGFKIGFLWIAIVRSKIMLRFRSINTILFYLLECCVL